MPNLTDTTNCNSARGRNSGPTLRKMYMDTMHLLRSNGFNYIVQGRCSLTHYLEFHMLWKENTQALGEWIFQDVLFRWGTLIEIISNNSKPFVTALRYLERKYVMKRPPFLLFTYLTYFLSRDRHVIT